MTLVKREQFIWNFVEQGKIPKCYSKLRLINASKVIDNSFLSIQHNKIENKTVCVNLFPGFLTPKLANPEYYNFKTIRHFNLNGAGILLNESDTIDNYLKENTSSSTRNNLKKRLTRLEFCFPIKYKMFYGDISHKEYNHLMENLFSMHDSRLQEKQSENATLFKYNYYKEISYSLIKDKKASLFVIYNKNIPLAISLNFHRNNMFFGTLSAYNIDYSKFSLGNILVFKLLEWSLENQYSFFDMGNGDLEYKKSWGSFVYDFEYHILYKKKSLAATILAKIEINKIHLKNYIKQYSLNGFLSKIASFGSEKKSSKILSNTYYTLQEIEQTMPLDNTFLKSISKDQNLSSELSKGMYDFLYSYKEHIDDISIFEITNETQSYIIKGKNKIAKISLNTVL